MKRRTFLLGAAALLLCGAATSCSAQKTDDEPILQQIEYSNLTDENTQTLLTGILKDAAVSDARIRLFANHVQRFNQDMDSAYSLQGAGGTASGSAEYTNAYRSNVSIPVVHCSSFRGRPPGAALSSHRKGYLRWSSYQHGCC